jgi:hypothetical protein
MSETMLGKAEIGLHRGSLAAGKGGHLHVSANPTHRDAVVAATVSAAKQTASLTSCKRPAKCVHRHPRGPSVLSMYILGSNNAMLLRRRRYRVKADGERHVPRSPEHLHITIQHMCGPQPPEEISRKAASDSPAPRTLTMFGASATPISAPHQRLRMNDERRI